MSKLKAEKSYKSYINMNENHRRDIEGTRKEKNRAFYKESEMYAFPRTYVNLYISLSINAL